MELLTNYGIIILNFLNEYFIFILGLIYGIFMIYFQIKYYKEKGKNRRLNLKIKAHGSVHSMMSQIFVDLLKENKEIRKENNKNIKLLKDTRLSRNKYQTKMFNYKRTFYSYDLARRNFFGKSAAGKVFYKSYTELTKKSMKFLKKSFIDSRKNLQTK